MSLANYSKCFLFQQRNLPWSRRAEKSDGKEEKSYGRRYTYTIILYFKIKSSNLTIAIIIIYLTVRIILKVKGIAINCSLFQLKIVEFNNSYHNYIIKCATILNPL
jgi:hypothetical protein